MAMTIETMRKLVEIDPSDPLSRFGLGRKLWEEGAPADWPEAAEHLRFANEASPSHLATYHIRGQVLIALTRFDEAKAVLTAGVERTAGIGEGMGRDLGPAMAELLRALPAS
ncbi:MAG: hypothetical protein ACRC1K_20400 [Planctomycetia bacterium]